MVAPVAVIAALCYRFTKQRIHEKEREKNIVLRVSIIDRLKEQRALFPGEERENVVIASAKKINKKKRLEKKKKRTHHLPAVVSRGIRQRFPRFSS